MEDYSISLPDDFKEYEWQIEFKGWFSGLVVEFGGAKYQLEFYDPTRLSQDISEELSTNSIFVIRNLVVIERLTRETMVGAVDSLVKSGELLRMNKMKVEKGS